ncbi:MAG: hypothetical protein ACRDBG_25110 [Waterburya sp.]
MATIKEMSEYFQDKYNLPKNWEVYRVECIPKDEYTHVQITGSLTDVFKRGPRKGKIKYTKEMEKTFILSNEELDNIGARSPKDISSTNTVVQESLF